jgi:hypothetical protein
MVVLMNLGLHVAVVIDNSYRAVFYESGAASVAFVILVMAWRTLRSDGDKSADSD